MSTIALKQFDTARSIDQTLLIASTPIDLTDCTVALYWYDINGQVIWKRTASIIDPDAGMVSYQVVDDDVANAGDFEVEWRITYPDNTILSVPTEGRIATTIYPALVVTP